MSETSIDPVPGKSPLMAIDPARVKGLFQAAIDFDTEHARCAFLDREVGDEPELRARLDALLLAHQQPLGVLDGTLGGKRGPDPDLGLAPTVAPGEAETEVDRPAPNDRGDADSGVPGRLIAGRYRIQQRIGAGGMGEVYLAEQTQPIRRRVALKLVRPGMDSRAVLTRFEAERQALALMDHPNIAKVLDAGTTEQGRPFFVMELVEGIPLTDYCDGHRLGIPARLGVFRQVCLAVQHAHQKGIIHRDLKPTNILVERHDGVPVPKVIDFGLAKATGGLRLSEDSLLTAFGSITGTPLYMAPEQATFNAVDIDTRADIYALGVILYELLTGSTPIDRGTIRRAPLETLLRVIREDEPPTPSSRIRTSATLGGVAATRLTDPVRLSRLVRGDLDWIVMKALAKERNRRYATAIGLADDIARFLNDEPVLAGPPTARYRTGKFIRRHRRQVLAAGLVVLALTGGTVGTTLGFFEARKQRDLARVETFDKERARAAEADHRRKAEAARQSEAEARETAERRSAQLGKVNDILGSIFRDLDIQQAEKDGKPVATAIGERLDQASAALDGESIGDPLTVARMQMTLGQAQFSLHNDRQAIALLERARASLVRLLGSDDRMTLECVALLSRPYTMDGQHDHAIAMLEPILPVMKQKLGPDDPVTLSSMDTLAMAYFDSSRIDGAITMGEQVLEARRAKPGKNPRDLLVSMDNLALAYRFAGRLDRAIPLHEKALAMSEANLGSDQPYTLLLMSNLALNYQFAGQFDRAILMNELALKGRRGKLGPDNVYTVVSLGNLGVAYQADGQIERSIPLQEQCLEMIRTRIGPTHPDVLISAHYLGSVYRDAGRFPLALSLLEPTSETMKAVLGPEHVRTLRCLNDLASAHRDVGSLDLAISLHERVVGADRATLGPDHPQTVAAIAQLARDQKAAGRYDRAIELFDRALAGRRARLGADHPDNLDDLSELAGAHAASGRRDTAIAIDRECREGYTRLHRADSVAMAAAHNAAGSRLLRWGEWAEAEPILRAALTIRRAKLPESWKTFDTQSLLGASLLGQGKHDEARPLLVAGLEGMKQRLATIPYPDRGEPVAAADRLVRLAEATGKPDEARSWREEKSRLEAQLGRPVPAEGVKP